MRGALDQEKFGELARRIVLREERIHRLQRRNARRGEGDVVVLVGQPYELIGLSRRLERVGHNLALPDGHNAVELTVDQQHWPTHVVGV